MIYSNGARWVFAALKQRRMARVFAVVWGRLPEAARLEVLAGLGTMQILFVSDNHFGRDVTASGYVLPMGALIFVHLASAGLADNRPYAAFVCAHELGHVAAGHAARTEPSLELTLAPDEQSLATSIYRKLIRERPTEPVTIGPNPERNDSGYKQREAEADAWAAKWGYTRPGAQPVEELANVS